jgi:hypothetical protein
LLFFTIFCLCDLDSRLLLNNPVARTTVAEIDTASKTARSICFAKRLFYSRERTKRNQWRQRGSDDTGHALKIGKIADGGMPPTYETMHYKPPAGQEGGATAFDRTPIVSAKATRFVSRIKCPSAERACSTVSTSRAIKNAPRPSSARGSSGSLGSPPGG